MWTIYSQSIFKVLCIQFTLPASSGEFNIWKINAPELQQFTTELWMYFNIYDFNFEMSFCFLASRYFLRMQREEQKIKCIFFKYVKYENILQTFNENQRQPKENHILDSKNEHPLLLPWVYCVSYPSSTTVFAFDSINIECSSKSCNNKLCIEYFFFRLSLVFCETRN